MTFDQSVVLHFGGFGHTLAKIALDEIIVNT